MSAPVFQQASPAAPVPLRDASREAFLEAQLRKNAVPPEWARGALHDSRRRVTDIPWLALFAANVVLLVAVTLWARRQSPARFLAAPRDSSGNACGRGKAKDFPFLYLQTMSAPYRSVCVRACPRFDYARLTRAPSGGGTPRPVYFEAFSRKNGGHSHTELRALSEAEAFAYPRDWAKGKFSEEQWNAYLRDYTLDCLPNAQVPACRQSPDFALYDSYAAARAVCVPLSPKAALLFNRFSASFKLGLLEDIRLLFPLLVRAALFSVALSFILLAVTLALPRVSVWSGAGLCTAALLLVVALALHDLFVTGPLNNAVNPLRVRYLQFWRDNRIVVLLLCLLAARALLAIAVHVLRLRNYFATPAHASALAMRYGLRQPAMVGLALGVLLTQLVIFLLGAQTVAHICAGGRAVKSSAQGAPFPLLALSLPLKALLLLYALGGAWAMATLGALSDFVGAALAVDCYFSAAIRPLHVVCHTLGYHIGSIALLTAACPLVALRNALAAVGLAAGLLPRRPRLRLQRLAQPALRAYDSLLGGFTPRALSLVYIGALGLLPAARTLHALTELRGGILRPLLQVGDFLASCARLGGALLAVVVAHVSYKASLALQQNVSSLWPLWLGAATAGYCIAPLLLNIICRTLDALCVSHLVQLELSRHGATLPAGPRELQTMLAELQALPKEGYRAVA